MCWSSSRKCRIFSAQLKCTANGISVQNVNVLPNIYGLIFEISANIWHEICWNIFHNKHFFSNFSKFLHLTFFPLIALVYSFKKSLWSFIISWILKMYLRFFSVLTPLSAVFQLYRLRVECTLFVIYKAGREPTPYWG